ncbi:MAG TPA: tRNA (adenosine(37)-N6)-threonylcarbamoyltransferase complex ATPase subunit type 1 TsaE [Planctomycetota bacterium]|nr:tRNA (adenosine(37)-N6)-threonylcarbamoyltransferase complex ATPase subunit type 1 TsaE [Planctomycetota bacterium]
MSSVTTRSPDETLALAAQFATRLNGGEIILLSGDLGAGKTVFVRGLARGLNVPPMVAITSPTYVLLHTYRGGRLTLHHIDAYRLGGGALEFEDSGLKECFEDSGAVVCIEWPEKIPELKWPRTPIIVAIEHVSPSERQIAITESV